MILAVKLVFSAATLAYALGYFNRIRNNDLHRRLMALGFVLTLSIAVTLMVGVYGFHSTYGPAEWLVDLAGGAGAARKVLLAHRAVASLTLAILIAQIALGVWRHPLHRRLFRVVAPLWLISFVTGLVIFV